MTTDISQNLCRNERSLPTLITRLGSLVVTDNVNGCQVEGWSMENSSWMMLLTVVGPHSQKWYRHMVTGHSANVYTWLLYSDGILPHLMG